MVDSGVTEGGQLESTFNHHHLRLSDVGNVSVPEKDSCLAGRPCRFLFHTRGHDLYPHASSTIASFIHVHFSTVLYTSALLYTRNT